MEFELDSRSERLLRVRMRLEHAESLVAECIEIAGGDPQLLEAQAIIQRRAIDAEAAHLSALVSAEERRHARQLVEGSRTLGV